MTLVGAVAIALVLFAALFGATSGLLHARADRRRAAQPVVKSPTELAEIHRSIVPLGQLVAEAERAAEIAWRAEQGDNRCIDCEWTEDTALDRPFPTYTLTKHCDRHKPTPARLMWAESKWATGGIIRGRGPLSFSRIGDHVYAHADGAPIVVIADLRLWPTEREIAVDAGSGRTARILYGRHSAAAEYGRVVGHKCVRVDGRWLCGQR